MKKNFLSLLLILILSTTCIYGSDAYLNNLNVSRFLKKSTPFAITVDLRNNSTSGYTTCTVSWQLDDGAINTSTNINFSSPGIGQNSYYTHTHAALLNISTEGEHRFKIWINAPNEENLSNDTIVMDLIVLSDYAVNTTLFEIYGSTTCPSCPAGFAAANTIANTAGNAVACFIDDGTPAFANAQYYFYPKYFRSTSGYTPAGVFNMEEFGGAPINSASPLWVNSATQRAGRISPALMTINPSINSNTRELTVDMTTNLKYIDQGKYFVNLYILENGIVGTQSGGSSYTYNNVVRQMLDGLNGDSTVIPLIPTINTDYTKSYSYTIPASWNLNRLSLIGMVYLKNDTNYYYAVNAIKYTYDHTGISQYSSEVSDFAAAYPNPFASELSVQFNEKITNATLILMTIDGKVVVNETVSSDIGEVLNYNWSFLPSGVYFLKVVTTDKTMVKKIQKL